MNDAEQLATELRLLATSAGSHIIAAPLDAARVPIPTVALSPSELLSLVTAIRPPIVYVFETALDADAEITSALEEMEVERGDPAFGEVTRAARRLAAHQGETARISVEIVAGGVLHACYSAAPWIVEFDDKVEAIAARIAEEGQTRVTEAQRATSARVRALAQRLLADPAFENGRPSFAKRRFLAGEIFPEEDVRTLDAVTETAENLRWLAASKV